VSLPWGAAAPSRGVVEDIRERVSGNDTTGTSTAKSDSSDNENGGLCETVTHLARTFTQCSVKNAHGQYVNPFEGSDDPSLNPHSGKFNQRAWIKTIMGIVSRDPERYPARIAGVSYKNLNVHGFGEPTDYQKTFGNYPLAISGLVNKLRGENERTKIRILRNFDGLIKSGEMLVVLGRPGRRVA
jgi:ATP-binding cassette, subfamily G (WHITE), member 2, PDR